MNREELGALLADRLRNRLHASCQQWKTTAPINHFYVDDMLPVDVAMQIRGAFPDPSTMMLRKSIREFKYVSSQMDKHAPLLEEITFAFQQPEVVALIAEITGLHALQPDEHLYAGGISMMGCGHFLNPHLDNSHDKDRKRYRSLNLLYYVSPKWRLENGGNLELWPDGTKAKPTTIVSKFNRLVVMVTNQHSWHSVSKSLCDQSRCCISNYYFSSRPVGDVDYFHPTSFRGRPDEPIRDLMLQADAAIRGLIRTVIPKGVTKTKHVYKKD
ncbi:2OG-Fe(II) oxygenase [Mycetohabitans sp. B5]|uniref:Rps23 Pro-64 3,4-dihydroxylase Tpa1-like proline 4-hydroxylase n=1 Tax=Mycetohabitans endofungorum TaxID=417203 RepID=A0A2P5KA43_9BURK|nr:MULTISPECIES: 2OG-Fe(II) oxygenase [Mycetohabitans]MCG1054654.1 2OG-Fe(II) oxygenase [Mycetohabitans sp. B5]PPB83601.1 Rps23 Pro-64 3,4-dihydroxylase Tpa1-like proline 4-hydroxylase [Mycetohabitans endofungorum]